MGGGSSHGHGNVVKTCYAESLMKSETRSPIMITVRAGPAWGIIGMIEASATQRFLSP